MAEKKDILSGVLKRIDGLSSIKHQETDKMRCPFQILKKICLSIRPEIVLKHEVIIERFLKNMIYVPPELSSKMWTELNELIKCFKYDLSVDEDILLFRIFSGIDVKGALSFKEDKKESGVLIAAAPSRDIIRKMHVFSKSYIANGTNGAIGAIFPRNPTSILGNCYVCNQKEGELQNIYNDSTDPFVRFRLSCFKVGAEAGEADTVDDTTPKVYLCEKLECGQYLKFMPEVALEYMQASHIVSNLYGQFINIPRSSGKVHKARVGEISLLGGKIQGISVYFFADEDKNVDNGDISTKMWEELMDEYPRHPTIASKSILTKEIALSTLRQFNPHVAEIIIYAYF